MLSYSTKKSVRPARAWWLCLFGLCYGLCLPQLAIPGRRPQINSILPAYSATCALPSCVLCACSCWPPQMPRLTSC